MSFHSQKNPNPQGKGLTPVLDDWAATRPALSSPREPAELLLDWFVSALVLSSEFRFRPALEQDYYLYALDARWRLSLVAPQEWGAQRFGDCLGTVRLREDMNWDIEPVADLGDQPRLTAALAAVVESFMQSLESDDALAQKLPGYRRDIPYYQRMLATGLGASLRGAAAASDMLERPARELALEAGEGLSRKLLGANSQAGSTSATVPG